MQYWLIKSESDCYSIDDLKRDTKTAWSGVRNFQARNFMRDKMKVGDLALFYHSSPSGAGVGNTRTTLENLQTPIGVYGIAKVVSAPYADETAFDPKDEHYDAKSKNKFEPTWMLVDFAFKKKFKKPITLAEIKNDQKLDGMMVRQKGSRLSIQPVSKEHFMYIVTMRQ